MRISQMIQALQQMQAEYGDLPAFSENGDEIQNMIFVPRQNLQPAHILLGDEWVGAAWKREPDVHADTKAGVSIHAPLTESDIA